MTDLDDLKAQAESAIQDHWTSCEEAALPHDNESCEEVIAAFETFFDAMATVEGPDDRTEALEAVEALYERLHRLNSKHDDSLLETDERELLVPIVIETFEACGFDPEHFDGEPGAEFRDF